MSRSLLLRIVIFLYITIVLVMSVATFVEHAHGTHFASLHIYGAWWFALLWALLAAAGIAWLVITRTKRFVTLLLHASLVIILLGAMLTHLFAYKGVVHLREGERVGEYLVPDPHSGEPVSHSLPFAVELQSFDIIYHTGTTSEQDYTTHFMVIQDGKATPLVVSMNKIATLGGVRFYQNSYDSDLRGSYLSINSDPYGVPVTYLGYALLFISLILMLIDPRGTFRTLLASPRLRSGILSICLCMTAGSAVAQTATAPTAVDAAVADQFGRLFVEYNGRIAPVQTFAIDFTKKLYGNSSYMGLSAEQVLMSWIFYADEWNRQPIIRIKSAEMRSNFNLDKYTSVSHFFVAGEYILGRYVAEYRQGNIDALHKACADIDGKLQLVMSLRSGLPLTMFPYTDASGRITWYSPAHEVAADSTDLSANDVPYMDVLFRKNYFAILYNLLLAGESERAGEIIGKLAKYQQKNGAVSIPSTTRVSAERAYNAVPFATILFMVNLTLGILSLLYIMYMLSQGSGASPTLHRFVRASFVGLMVVSWIALSVCIALRWIVSGRVPMSNGYETMLLMAWFTMLLSLIAYRRFRIALTFGFVLSGFFLLVSHISQMDPQITHAMPVLSSPLLSLHVSVIMLAYALLSFTFLCGLMAVVLHIIASRDSAEQIESLRVLSALFLYPAIAALGFGIFIGAIWANVSWGAYWSWDPKEVWALITLMVYAVPLHGRSLPAFTRPLTYHIYMVAAYATILMTYFGVNYILGGMHSYA